MRIVLPALGVLATLMSVLAAPASAQEYGGRDDDGGEALPADFHGRITYQGSYSAEASRAGRAPANASPIVRRIARGNDRSWTEDGTITITVTFDGNRIQGSHIGSGGMGRGSFTGTRSGRWCTFSSGQGDTNTVECTRALWRGTSRSAPGARVEATVRIEARANQVVDSSASAVASRTGPPPGRQGSTARLNPSVAAGCRVFPQPGARIDVYGVNCFSGYNRPPSNEYTDAKLSALAGQAGGNAEGMTFSLPHGWTRRPDRSLAMFGPSSASFAGSQTRCVVGVPTPAVVAQIRGARQAPQTAIEQMGPGLEGANAREFSVANLIDGRADGGEVIGLDYTFSSGPDARGVRRHVVFLRDFGRGNTLFAHCQSVMGPSVSVEYLTAAALIATTASAAINR